MVAGDQTNKNQGRGNSLQREETVDLLALWGEEKIQRELRQSHRNHEVFAGIAKGMVACGHRRTAEECQSKTKTMHQFYKKCLAHNSLSGRDRITCPFYEELDQILLGRADVRPMRVANSLVLQYEPATGSTSNPEGGELQLLDVALEVMEDRQGGLGENDLRVFFPNFLFFPDKLCRPVETGGPDFWSVLVVGELY